MLRPASLALLLSAIVVALPSVVGAAPTEGVRVGELAPPVNAERVAGPDAVSLDELRGRVVVVDFWATWCGPCRAIMPGLDAIQRLHRDAGLTVLGIARERERDIRDHLTGAPVSYTVARDVGGTLSRYGVRSIPMLVVLDRGGRVRDVMMGTGRGALTRLNDTVARLLAEPAPASH